MDQITISPPDLLGASTEVSEGLAQRLVEKTAECKALWRTLAEKEARIAELEEQLKQSSANRAQRRATGKRKS